MTSLRNAEIAKHLNDWLFSGRYNPPRDFRGNERAEQAEAEALLGVLLKFAPQVDPSPFIKRVLDQLEYQMKVRVWPNKGELGAVCANIRKEAPPSDSAGSGREVDMTDAAVTARKMQAGLPVGEGALWGSLAVEIAARGLIDADTMRRYRSGAFLARKTAYGEASALAWEAERKAAHEAAKAVWRDRGERRQRDASIPAKSAIPQDFAA